MKRVLTLVQVISRSLWWLAISLVIMVGVVVAVARLGLPMVSDYRAEVEQRLHQELGVNLAIGAVDAQWHGLHPELRVSGLDLLDEQGLATGVHFDQMRITLDLWATLRSRQLQPADLELSGSRLDVTRGRDGRLSLRGWRSTNAINWDAALAWVLRHRLIRLADTRVSVEDLATAVRFEIVGAEVYLLNVGDGHRLTASAEVKSAPGAPAGSRIAARLTAAADMIGEGAGLGQGAFYLGVEDVVLQQPQLHWLPTIDGGDLRLWARRVDDGWFALEGELRGLMLHGDKHSNSLPLENTAFRSRLSNGVWHTVAGPIAELVRDDDTRVWLDWHAAPGLQQALDIKVDRVDAHTLSSLLVANSRIPERIRSALSALDPRGKLDALRFSKLAGDPALKFSSRFSGLSSQSWRGVPRLDGLDGGLSFDSGTGRLTLQASGGSIEMTGLFAESWPLDRLEADVALTILDDDIQVALNRVLLENPDLAIEVRGGVTAPRAGGAPYLDLVMAFYRGNGEQLRRYLPLKGLSAKARKWLARAIVAGQVTGGGAVFRGQADQFPFNDAEGRLEVAYDVDEAVIDYANGWPRLEQVDVAVQFVQQDMTIFGVGGHILDAEMEKVEVSLPGLKRPNRTVHLDGKLDLAVAEVREFILNSPLAKKYSPFVESLVTQGNGSLRLKLELPLTDTSKARVSGELSMRGTDLRWKESGLVLGKVNGRLGFDDNGLSGQDLGAVVMGRPVRIDVEPGIDRGKPVTFVRLAGSIDRPLLEKTLGKAAAGHFSGKAGWRGRISLPKDPHGKLYPQLVFESSLKGLAIKLPEPIGKSAKQAVKLTIGTELGDPRRRPIWFSYGGRLGGMVELNLADNALLRGALRFGGDIPQLPASRQLLVRGKLQRLSVDRWVTVFDQLSAAAGGSRAPTADWLQRLGEIRLSVGHMELFGQRYSDLKIKASQDASRWVLHLDGDEIKGDLVLPNDRNAVVLMNMDRLHAAPPNAKRGIVAPDPRTLPPMNIKVRDFRFDGLDLGSLELIARQQPLGLRLEKLALESSLLKVAAKGNWEVKKGRHSSAFDIEFSADSLGEMFHELGFVNTIEGGSTTGTIKARWAGSPSEFALGRLNGSFSIEIGSGSLLQFDPGAGRIFGLLSPQVFTHTLGERYQDLSGKGFYFEEISADYRLEGGNAYTENLHVNGPVARIEISGRIGLLARDYNQYVEVIPRVSSGLTLASGALAIGNPPLGAALLLAQTVFGETLDTIGARYYLISGGWEKPQVMRLKRPRSN